MRTAENVRTEVGGHSLVGAGTGGPKILHAVLLCLKRESSFGHRSKYAISFIFSKNAIPVYFSYFVLSKIAYLSILPAGTGSRCAQL